MEVIPNPTRKHNFLLELLFTQCVFILNNENAPCFYCVYPCFTDENAWYMTIYAHCTFAYFAACTKMLY